MQHQNLQAHARWTGASAPPNSLQMWCSRCAQSTCRTRPQPLTRALTGSPALPAPSCRCGGFQWPPQAEAPAPVRQQGGAPERTAAQGASRQKGPTRATLVLCGTRVPEASAWACTCQGSGQASSSRHVPAGQSRPRSRRCRLCAAPEHPRACRCCCCSCRRPVLHRQ